MSAKSQLNACGESLMIGIRLMERAVARDPAALSTLRACLDLVERLERSSANLDVTHVETALAAVTQTSNDVNVPTTSSAVLAAIRNAADRLNRLRSELAGDTQVRKVPAFLGAR
jgi:hypothetical protein